jgi:hypothetical protein
MGYIRIHIRCEIITSILLSLSGFVLAGEERDSAKDQAFFESKIRPQLAQYCYECHSAKSGKSKGHLRVDNLSALLKGGESGPAIVPGAPEKSLLVRAIQYTDENTQMPPKGKLPPLVVEDLTRWVKMGAPWPAEKSESSTAAAPVSGNNYDKLRAEHWCWQPVKAVEPPIVQDTTWSRDDIDRFVLAGLEKNKLPPAPDAERRILLRRLYFDLTGLPPTPEELAQFLSDESPSAADKVIDRLLASPRFGERWGRHWMDVVRYADSVGSGANITFDYAWRYRDYIIAAFNHDKPYDQFLREQIAGDLLPAANAAQSREQRIGTAFLAMGQKELAEYDKEKLRWDIIDEQIDTVGQAFMGLTMGCARCHDHKFDPIPTSDYYALAGIFSSIDTLSEKPWEGVISGEIEMNLDPTPENEKKWNEYEKAVQDARSKVVMVRTRLQELQTLEAQVAQKRAVNAPPAEIAAAEAALQKKKSQNRPVLDELKKMEADLARKKADPASKPDEIERLSKEFNRLKALPEVSTAEMTRLENVMNAPHPDRLMTVRESKTPANARIHIRGETQNLGAEVPRGVLTAVRTTAPKISKGSGRLELAQWLTQPNHPLTARVMVNRVWSHLFGAGLVRSPDNFGVRGETPTHPELLDYLATKFVSEGWSVKKLVREIVSSRAYRMSSIANAAALKLDPENRLLWRQNRRRLEAESIRDSMLFLSGALDETMGGSTMTSQGRLLIPESSRLLKYDPSLRRTVYVPVYRGILQLDILDVFNFAEPGMVTGRRSSTQVPTQALFLLNSPFVMEQAERIVQRIDNSSPEQILRALYLRILGREPDFAEQKRAHDFVHAQHDESSSRTHAAWAQFCHALMASNEFLFVD